MPKSPVMTLFLERLKVAAAEGAAVELKLRVLAGKDSEFTKIRAPKFWLPVGWQCLLLTPNRARHPLECHSGPLTKGVPSAPGDSDSYRDSEKSCGRSSCDKQIPKKDYKEMDTMNRRTTLTLTALTFLCLGIALPASDAVGQQKTLNKLIVGTWILDSYAIRHI